jgi:hypothetical protein
MRISTVVLVYRTTLYAYNWTTDRICTQHSNVRVLSHRSRRDFVCVQITIMVRIGPYRYRYLKEKGTTIFVLNPKTDMLQLGWMPNFAIRNFVKFRNKKWLSYFTKWPYYFAKFRRGISRNFVKEFCEIIGQNCEKH